MESPIKLTQYAHGAGCGCKIDSKLLSKILANNEYTTSQDPRILVGNADRDDAAVMDLGNGEALITTCDFFTPIVDDAYKYGQIAAANALSDVYAMGGKPMMALALLGWPTEKLGTDLANQVMQGARDKCREAGIYILGGHSIDAAEPFFGLTVNGTVALPHLKQNHTVQEGDLLYLTKPIGTGLISTAQKMDKAHPEHYATAIESMSMLNQLPTDILHHSQLHALTDVTGFGLLGHLSEMLADRYTAVLDYEKLPKLPGADTYIAQMCIPGATYRNWNAVSPHCQKLNVQQLLLCNDPQTSGGLLLSVAPELRTQVEAHIAASPYPECAQPIAEIVARQELAIVLSS